MWLHPELPGSVGHLHVAGIRIGDARVTVTVDDGHLEISGTGALEVINQPRPPLTATLTPTPLPLDTQRDERAD